MSSSRGGAGLPGEAGKKRPAPFGGVGPYLLLGWQIALAFVVYAAIGYGLDVWLGTTPWLLLAGVLLGLVAVFARLHRLVIELNRHTPPKSKRPEDAPTD